MQIDDSQLNKGIDLQGLSPHDLLFPANFESVKFRAYNLIDSYNTVGALSFSTDLERLIKGLNPSNQEDNYVYSIMLFWLLRLKIFSFRKIKEQEKVRLIKEQSVRAASWGLGLKDALSDYLKTFHSRKMVESTARDFYLAMVASEEVLGAAASMTKNNSFKPTLGNWIREYQAVMQSTGEEKIGPGAFHIVKFLDTNQMTKGLTGTEKQVLQVLLDQYNSLLSPDLSDTFEEIPEDDQSNQNPSYVNQQRFKITEDSRALAELVQPEQKTPPSIPKPAEKADVKRVGMDEILKSNSQQKTNPPSSIPTEPKPVVQAKKTASEELPVMRPGLSFSSVLPDYKKPIPSAVINAETLAQQMEKKHKEEQVDIDKKLQNLEERVKKGKE